MRKHKGEHPRLGALDVCPFIPVQDVTVEECVEVSKKFGARLAEELKVLLIKINLKYICNLNKNCYTSHYI